MLDLCANFNLHYCDEPFFLKLDHCSGYIVKGICQKRCQFLIVQSHIMRNMLDIIFFVINNKLNRNAGKLNWLCSNGLIRIKTGRIPTYLFIYKKPPILRMLKYYLVVYVKLFVKVLRNITLM